MRYLTAIYEYIIAGVSADLNLKAFIAMNKRKGMEFNFNALYTHSDKFYCKVTETVYNIFNKLYENFFVFSNSASL